MRSTPRVQTFATPSLRSVKQFNQMCKYQEMKTDNTLQFYQLLLVSCQTYVYLLIFMKTCSKVFRYVDNKQSGKQTNRQTDK